MLTFIFLFYSGPCAELILYNNSKKSMLLDIDVKKMF